MTTYRAWGMDSHGGGWWQRAACRDENPDWWVLAAPDDHDGRAGNWRALLICAGCPPAVQRLCVQFGLDSHAEGTIHGGIPFGPHVFARWRTCERPGCHGRWVSHSRNRMRLYCSTYCRKATDKARQDAVARARRAKQRVRARRSVLSHA